MITKKIINLREEFMITKIIYGCFPKNMTTRLKIYSDHLSTSDCSEAKKDS